MKSFASWMIVMFIALFWLLRIAVAFTYSLGMDFMATPLNESTEIILLFVAFICMLLIIKRNLIGAIAYVISYGMYFGVHLYNNIIAMINQTQLSLNEYTNIFFSFVGVIIPIMALFDVLMDKNRTAHPKDKKTDWFYKNEQYDRKLDDRADKNNYRTM